MNKTKPFLKYSGCKLKQMPDIRALLTKGERLVEPFVGSGAVFLNTNYNNYLLADTNTDLINVYKILAAYQEEFITFCKGYFGVINNNPDVYYYYRDIFNNLSLSKESADRRIEMAALFIYLNIHGFHGITRYNANGEFNVPYGYYAKPYFPENEMHTFIDKINACDLVEFRVADFRETLAMTKRGDVIYCDPPYTPLSASANFTKYYGEDFTWYSQVELLTICKKLKAEKNITSIISNQSTTEVVSLSEGKTFSMVKSFVNRSVGGVRTIAPEVMVCV
jgi:DNA adenine methylase